LGDKVKIQQVLESTRGICSDDAIPLKFGEAFGNTKIDYSAEDSKSLTNKDIIRLTSSLAEGKSQLQPEENSIFNQSCSDPKQLESDKPTKTS